MYSPLSQRLLGFALSAALSACGSDLTLPDDGFPPLDDRAPARVDAVSGFGQQARVGKRLNDPLVARVTDAASRPVVGALVEFRFQGSVPAGEVSPSEATTDEEGYARAEVRLGTTPGLHTVEARLAQAEVSNLLTTFGVIALAHGGRGDGSGGDDDDDDD